MLDYKDILNLPINIKVCFIVPDKEKYKCKYPSLYGEHFGYDGASGVILAPASKDVVWVCFENTIYKYVGCPVDWLHIEER